VIPVRRRRPRYMNKHSLKVEKANKMWNLTRIIPSEKTPTRALFSDMASADTSLLEEEDKRKIFYASVASSSIDEVKEK